ncbi:hypothetical protein [Effusibacillus consociatus]|uniref:hypothetical protein n=1 Tax=Effusibacillus consociatus TaxID=1117041 RepID=UPI0036D2D30A
MKIRMNQVAVLVLFSSLMTGCVKSGSSTESGVAAAIGEEKITTTQVEKVFKERYYDVILDNLIDNRLLEIKAKELGIQQVNDPDEKKLNGLQGELQQRKFLLKAILMKTLDDNTLKKFYGEQKGELESLSSIRARVYKIDHQLASKFITLHQNEKDHTKLEKELGIATSQIESVEVTFDDPIYQQLRSLKTGEVTMVMQGQEHLIVLVEDIKSGEPLVWPKDRDKIAEAYLLTHTGEEQLKLLDKLRSEYKIQKRDVQALTIKTS